MKITGEEGFRALILSNRLLPRALHVPSPHCDDEDQPDVSPPPVPPDQAPEVVPIEDPNSDRPPLIAR